ncbi:MAG: ankyrin repeat domain-containing protein [Planctomycetota bacterium]
MRALLINNFSMSSKIRLAQIISVILIVTLGVVSLAHSDEVSIFDAIDSRNIEKIKEAIANGADLNARNYKYGYLPLHYALFNGYKEMVEFLLIKDADVNILNNDGNTPLDVAIAVAVKNSQEVLVALLREYGAKCGNEIVKDK